MTTSVASEGSLGSTDPPNGGGMAFSGVGTDSLQDTVAGMSKHQLYQLVSQMKNLIHQNQQQARQILIDNPQLTKTLFQAQIMLGMVRAPDTPPLASAPARPPQPLAAVQLPPEALRPPISQPPAAVLQQLPNQQPAPLPAPPPQIASTYLQQPQVSGAAVQLAQPSFSYQQTSQPHQQSTPLANPVQPHSQPLLAASTLQPSIQHGTSLPSLPLHPPLPQQPRPVAPASHIQHPNTQAVGFIAHPSQPYQTAQSSYLQQGGPPQISAGPQFQQMLTPPLPSQPPPQQLFQVPQSGNFNMTSSSGAVEAGRGLSMGISSSAVPLMTWNQAIPSSVPVGVPQVTPVVGATMNMAPGNHPFNQTGSASSMVAPGSNSNPPQVYNQALAQAQPPQQLQHQPQMQMSIELEQQKALLQQVMNLTPEQINSLPMEQRQQVLQLQAAFRSQTG